MGQDFLDMYETLDTAAKTQIHMLGYPASGYWYCRIRALPEYISYFDPYSCGYWALTLKKSSIEMLDNCCLEIICNESRKRIFFSGRTIKKIFFLLFIIFIRIPLYWRWIRLILNSFFIHSFIHIIGMIYLSECTVLCADIRIMSISLISIVHKVHREWGILVQLLEFCEYLDKFTLQFILLSMQSNAFKRFTVWWINIWLLMPVHFMYIPCCILSLL